MSKIAEVRTTKRKIPLHYNQRMGSGELSAYTENVFVRIETTDGLVGYGEAGPWAIFCAESPTSIVASIEEELAPLIVGMEPHQWRPMRLAIDRAFLGRDYAKSAIEMAIFDLIGKQFDLPLHDVLGGAVRDCIKLSYSVSDQTINTELEKIGSLVEKGYAIFKVKSGILPPEGDAERLLAIRRSFPEIEIRLDFNEQGSVQKLSKLLPAIREIGASVIEQPFPAGDVNSLVWFSHHFDGILMADESCRNQKDLVAIAQDHLFQALSLKIHKMGGISKTLDLYSAASTHGLKGYCGGTSDTGLATYAVIELCLCLPQLLEGCDLYFPLEILATEITEPLIKVHEGAIWPTNLSGIGVNIPDEWFYESDS
ncbi:MAG: hypothetical protein F6K26_12505 [Moorea sp. SIO2I5]|nr:hypothetical protein [Moorena sp. SIO2I5]